MELPAKEKYGLEEIDLEKLRAIIAKNRFVIIGIFLFTLGTAYLLLRYTKNVYQAESELKLDVKQDARLLNINPLQDDENLNVIAGEIEQIKSKVFLSRVIDSLQLDVSYYVQGKLLSDELYRRSPFEVRYQLTSQSPLWDSPVSTIFGDQNEVTLTIGEERISGSIDRPIKVPGGQLEINKTASYDSYPDNDFFFIVNSKPALLSYFLNNITVVPINFNANTIKIAFQDYNAFKAFDIVNTIDSLYLSYSNEQKNLTTRQKIDWLNNELTQVEQKMEDYENYFENFTLENKTSDLEEDLKKTVEAIYLLDSQRLELRRNISTVNVVIERLQNLDDSVLVTPKKILPEYVNNQLTELQKQRIQLALLALSYNENTFAYRQKEQEVNALQGQVFKQMSEIRTDLLTQLNDLNIQRRKLEDTFASMPDKNTQLAKNRRFYKLQEEFYLLMMKSKAEFEIAQAGSTPDFKILSSATCPTTPISPNRLLIMGIAFVAALVINFFLIGITYLANNKITNVRDVERAVTAPLLGSIPLSNHRVVSSFHVLDNPKSMVSESIRILRTNLDFFATQGAQKVIAISSTVSGEGKSFLSLNLGGVLAMSKKKVILVDLDMRKQKPAGKSYGDTDQEKGVSTILINRHSWRECVVATPLPNFEVLPPGPHPPNPSELLLNGEFVALLDELKKNYDYVIIDTPPVGLVTDGIMAMKKSDIAVFVVRANYSKREFLAQLQRVININKLNHVAMVVNAVPSSRKSYEYGYYEDQVKEKRSWGRIFKTG